MFPPWPVVFLLLPLVTTMQWNEVEVENRTVVLKENSTYWRDEAAKRLKNYDYRDMNEMEEDEEEPLIPFFTLLRIVGICYAATQTIIIFLMMPEIYTDYIRTDDDEGTNAIHLVDLPHLVADKMHHDKDKEKEKEKTKEEEDVLTTKKTKDAKKKEKKNKKKAKKHKRKKPKTTTKHDDTTELHTAPEEGSWIVHLPEDDNPIKMVQCSKERPQQSQKLPRAKKGHQQQFLDDMDDFLLGDEADQIEKDTRGELEAKPVEKPEKHLTTERVHTAVEPTEDPSDVEKPKDEEGQTSSGARRPDSEN